MTQYFVRFSDSREWLEADAERGYSFHSYIFDKSPRALLQEHYGERVEEIEDSTDTIEEEEEKIAELADEMNVRQHSNGQYGFALGGLCGYGPFESLEEAEEESRNGSYGIYTTCGIFEGHEAGGDPDGNPLFRPAKLVKVVESVAA